MTNVIVRTSGDAVSGSLSGGGKTWHSARQLDVSQSYTVTATATDSSGTKVTSTSTFRTLTPAQTFSTMIYEGYQQTYGVGMPIMLTFSTPITNKAAVERSLELTTSKPVIGAWYWDGDEHLYFRPRDYWQANTTVSFNGHLNGVQGAKGVYATANLNPVVQHRPVADRRGQRDHPPHADLPQRQARLRLAGQAPAGPASTPTYYLSVEKANPVRMVGGGAPGSAGYYDELVNYAVRFTFSGDYYHSAPWSVVNQGSTNVSHGCVNLPPEAAVTYYNMSIPGDPITVTNSTAAGKWGDGWTQWFLTWAQYLHGSALGQAVMAGPQGGAFVSPSSLPASTATAPAPDLRRRELQRRRGEHPGVAFLGGFPQGGDALAHADAHAGRPRGRHRAAASRAAGWSRSARRNSRADARWRSRRR